MDKETILNKARREKDEMEVQVRAQSMKYVYLVMVLSAAVFALVRGLQDQPIMDLCATVCYSVFAGRIYCYIRTKERFQLIMAVISLAVAVMATVRFFMGH